MTADADSLFVMNQLGGSCFIISFVLFIAAAWWTQRQTRKGWRGRIEPSEDGDGPIGRIVIRQRDLVGGTGRRWEEFERCVSVRPFVVKVADGTHLLVAADHNALLVCDLRVGGEQVYKTTSGWRHAVRVLFDVQASWSTRTCTGQITSGEEVFVAGVLDRTMSRPDDGLDPYRASHAGPRPIIRPPVGGRLLIATSALDRMRRGRVRLHLVFAAYALVALILAQVLALPFRDAHAALAPRLPDNVVAAIWLGALVPLPLYAYLLLRMRPWYRRHRLVESD